MAQRSLFKKDFHELDGRVYLNTGAEGLLLKSCSEAVRRYLRTKNLGTAGRPELCETNLECKRKISCLLGATPDEVAFLSNASDGISRLCNSLDWSPGRDEIVINDQEFPSNILPWLRLQQRGVRLKIARSKKWSLQVEDFEKEINSKTRIVSISHVSYMTGRCFDIEAIGKLAHAVGAIFCVDATQSLGRIPVSIGGIDYLVCSTYKWLLAPHGAAIVYCNRELLKDLQPNSIGWWSVADLFTTDRFESYQLKRGAARLELGMPNFSTIYALSDAVSYLMSAGIETIDDELRPVCDYLIEELQKLKVELMTPCDPGHRAGIISFGHPESGKIAELLALEDIHVWGGDDRVRISVHLYNDMTDIEKLLAALTKHLGRA